MEKSVTQEVEAVATGVGGTSAVRLSGPPPVLPFWLAAATAAAAPHAHARQAQQADPPAVAVGPC